MEPLADSNPSERKAAKEETPAPEAFAWLANPQPPPPPIDRNVALHELIASEIAMALGWTIDQTKAAIAELHSYPTDADTPPPTTNPEEDTEA